ncbi:MAG: hypothetical protein OHK0026_05810 [Rhodocyclaceae bacterium]
MPNIAVTFRQEITRLARREIRVQMEGLRKASTQFRKDIAELKRHASGLRSELARLRRRTGESAAPEAAEADPANVRFSAKGIISQRKRLGISAADYGKLIGVTAHTIYNWEHGASRPRGAQLSALASVRGLGKRAVLARLEQAPAPRRARVAKKTQAEG